MPRRIEDAVAKNRTGRRQLNSRFIETGTGGGGGAETIVAGNELRVGVLDVGIYTRDLAADRGSGLIVGHPDPEHGIGRGLVGDNRSAWSLVETVTESVALTADGKKALARALVGNEGTITALGVGTGTTPATEDDTALESAGGRTFAFGLFEDREDAGGIDEGVVTARGLFRFHEFGDTTSEVGAIAGDSEGETLVARTTTDGTDPTRDQELRADLDFRVGADAVGDTAFTDAGEQALAGALVQSAAVALDTVAIGSGTDATTDADIALGAEIGRQPDETTAVVRPRGVSVRARWDRDEPDGQPVTVNEIGVLNDGGDLVWRALVAPYEKSDVSAYTTGMTLAVLEG